MAQFFHSPNRKFDQSHPSIVEDMRADREAEEEFRRNAAIQARSNQKVRLLERKAEREVLQYASSQGMSGRRGSRAIGEELSITQPLLAAEYRMKKSLTYKDPSKTELLNSTSKYSYNNLTLKQLKGLLTPQVLHADEDSLVHIENRFKLEQEAEEVQQAWHEYHREKRLRALCERRKATNLLLYKSGVPELDTKKYSLQSKLQPIPVEKLNIKNDSPQIPQLDLSTTRRMFARRKISELTSRLSVPRRHYKAENPYLHSDYRGLIHVDYGEAVENLNCSRKRGSFLQKISSHSVCKERPRPSATNLCFPTPSHCSFLHPTQRSVFPL